MIASKPDMKTAIPVGVNWLESVSAYSLAGIRHQQRIARTVAETSAEAAQDYADHMRRLCLADDPMTAWACHDAWMRKSWQDAQGRFARIGAALRR